MREGGEIRWQRPSTGGSAGFASWRRSRWTRRGRFAGRCAGRPASRVERLARPLPATGRGRPGAAGEGAAPRGPGQVQRDVWGRSFGYRGAYPSGRTCMQLLAAYDRDGKAGLYVGMHDPLASTKDIIVESRPAEQAVTLAFEHPAANMGVGGNGFELGGEAVWQVLHGDWFDAAVIYRDWVRRAPAGIPARARGPAVHAPDWMRELSAWALAFGTPRRVPGSGQGVPEVPGRSHWLSLVQLAPDPLRQRLSALLPDQAGLRRGGPRAPGVGHLRDALHQRPALGHAGPGHWRTSSSPAGLAGRDQG